MKKLISPACLLLAAAACIQVNAQQVQLLDSIAAVVDEDVVMTSELEARMEAISQRLAQSETEAPPRDVLLPQVLERLIVERIQLDMGRRAGIRISDEELNQAIAGIAQNQGMTLDQFLAGAAESGLSVHELKNQIMEEMIISRVQQARVNQRIFISEQEVENFLASDEGRAWNSPDVNLGHILLPLSSGASQETVEETRQLAQTLRDRLAEGEDFRSLAIAYSGDQNALQGGDLGWRKLAQLPDIFINALNDLEPGEVTTPIRSDAGIHLLKLYDKRGSTQQIIQQSKVRHILLKPNEIRNDEETRAELESIARQIREGADFAEMAKAHSEDIGSALSGGDLGWSLPGKFVPQFEQALNNADVGEVTNPFRSQFGWHILQVTERRDQDFSEDIRRNQAENILRQRKFEEELQIWLQEIRDEAYVDIKI